MDEYTTSSASQPSIRGLLKDKKVRVVLIIAIAILFFAWVLKGVLGTLVGVQSGISMDGMYVPTVSLNEASYGSAKVGSSRIAMDYDESYPVPTPAPGGGTGSYEENAYETRQYSASIKTGEYDSTVATIESWKPLPYVIFEQATKGERNSYFYFKVERERADEVLKELEKLSPTDLSQQTEVVKKQLLDYSSRLDVLAKQEELLTDMLEKVNVAYDELVTLSKNAGEVKVLASVIDDKLKYINQLSQQRLTVSNQIEAIAKERAELADRVDYVYFNVTVTKYEFINTDQLKDSWVARVQTFVRETNQLVQAVTIGLVGLLLWLLQALLYIVVIGSLALFVGKHGYRAVVKYWQS